MPLMRVYGRPVAPYRRHLTASVRVKYILAPINGPLRAFIAADCFSPFHFSFGNASFGFLAQIRRIYGLEKARNDGNG